MKKAGWLKAESEEISSSNTVGQQ